jgi:hypothetical protein
MADHVQLQHISIAGGAESSKSYINGFVACRPILDDSNSCEHPALKFIGASALLVLFVSLLSLAAGCAHLPNYALPGPGASPTPISSPFATPSPNSSPTPANCATPASNTTAFIVMSVVVTATTAPSYGAINGYIVANSDGSFNNVATVINLHHADLVQFVNADSFGPAPIFHSAVNFPGAAKFPTPPISFPPGTALPIDTLISSAQWSTGRLPPSLSLCYSQQFTVAPGTYYIGDFDFYNAANMRDVIVVSSSAARRSSGQARVRAIRI